MEFLNCGFEGRALLLADDTDFLVDGLTRSRNLLKKWDREDAVDSIGFLEPLLPNTTSKSFRGDRCLESNGDHTKDHAAKSMQSASSMTQNTLMEFGTTFSSSTNKANNEKFASASQSKGNLFCADSSMLSSPESSVSTKRVKITNLQSPIPTCQVFGCNKDLSSSKDYHKRHKVCDVHSKTAVVVVNGTRQRFCQQCSRFHVLAEFDESKRSCRKRLAGHNERRRKPQFNTHLGSTYFTTDASNSLIFSRTLPGGFFGLQSTEAGQASKLAVDVKLSQSVLRFHGMGKQYPSKNCLNAPSSLPELYSSSDSGCALSLLSSRKHNSGMSMARSLISTAQNSATALGESSFNSFTPLVYNSNRDARVTVDSDIPSTETRTLKLKSYLSPQGANTVNLLELSLHLQRVEKQKYSGQIKVENDIFSDSTIA